MATHWSGDGSTPDGFSATWVSFWIFAGITFALTLGALVLVIAGSRFPPARVWAGITTLIAGFTAAAWVAAAWATADAPSLAQASLGGRLAVLLVAITVAAIVFLLTPAADPGVVDPAPRPEALALDPGERAAWSARISSPMFLAIAAGLVLLAIVSAIAAVSSHTGSAFIGVAVFLAAALSILVLTPVRLTVDHRGIRLTSITFRIPLIRLDLSSIESVSAHTIDPLEWGGWGYRVSGRGRAYVSRRGPGIVIRRHDASPIAITVNHPEQAAATANALTHDTHPSN
ncbi:hypothetical protein [Herbiconiux sp. A18JL235]|uniref:DUF1648 domain-containing protein n=1 Tax=Herbiconiux sp. A18JL235 TaxID=3152363 RepID=A0AB39BMQ9_9MICO